METVSREGITWVTRGYQCLDCDWSWKQTCRKDEPLEAECPECHNALKHRMNTAKTCAVKDSRLHGEQPPARKTKVTPGAPAIRSSKGRAALAAADMAFNEAQKMGFSDMRDSGLRNGDICAPPVNNIVSQVQDKMFGGGWRGSSGAGAGPGDTGGRAALGMMTNGMQRPDTGMDVAKRSTLIR